MQSASGNMSWGCPAPELQFSMSGVCSSMRGKRLHAHAVQAGRLYIASLYPESAAQAEV